MSRDIKLSLRIKYCRGISKYTGLVFSRKIRNVALVFEFSKEKIISLHMFFVFFPIDVIWLDKNKKVVEIKERLLPFSYHTPKNKAKYVIELPAGFVCKKKIKISQKIDV